MIAAQLVSIVLASASFAKTKVHINTSIGWSIEVPACFKEMKLPYSVGPHPRTWDSFYFSADQCDGETKKAGIEFAVASTPEKKRNFEYLFKRKHKGAPVYKAIEMIDSHGTKKNGSLSWRKW